MAIVKSDAYGHGMIRCAKAFEEVGARIFGVAEVDEGMRLRAAGIIGEIYVLLGARSREFNEVIHYDLRPVVFDLPSLRELSRIAEGKGKRVGVHLKIDTGMGRLGIMPHEAPFFIEAMRDLPGVYLDGILSHFPKANEPGFHETMVQCRLFMELLEHLNQQFPGRKASHIASSAAIFRNEATHFDMVRPGITLYGLYPEGVDQTVIALSPVMRFTTEVVQVKDVPAGYGLSYGHLYVTERPSQVAVLAVGYDDGYLRRLSNRAEVLVHGKRAPVCGRVCMNACMIDVTDIPEVLPGDEVVLLGRQGEDEITAEEVAGWLETINYEVVCLFGGRNQRVYKGEGENRIQNSGFRSQNSS